QRPWRPGAVATACAELGGADERRATRISRHAGCELPKRRGAAARKFSQLGAAQCAGLDAGNGAISFPTGAETDHIPQRPRLELLILKGTLGVDKPRLLQELRA